jgi:glycosyltransferase involved in cell wall biosynthesis
MPAHNSQAFISESIRSVILQTYTDWELLVADDCSTDATKKIVAGFAQQDDRIKLVELDQRSGPAKARNAAIACARGHLIAFLDSDDIWLPEKLKKQVALMEETGAYLSYTACKKIDAKGKIGAVTITVPEKLNYADLLKRNPIPCLTAVFDRAQLGAVHLPEDLRREDYSLWLNIVKKSHYHEDYAFWLQILRRRANEESLNPKVVGLNEVLALYRVHRGSISRNKFRAALLQWNVYRKVERLSIAKSLYFFLHYAYHGFNKARKF